jgi:hypothetical protein
MCELDIGSQICGPTKHKAARAHFVHKVLLMSGTSAISALLCSHNHFGVSIQEASKVLQQHLKSCSDIRSNSAENRTAQ